MKYVFLYVTNPDEAHARKIAKVLLKKKLIACANFIPIRSMYPWKGKFMKEKEIVAIFKTPAPAYKKVQREIERIHTYKIPCIAKIAVEFNEPYQKWLDSNTR